MKKDLGIFGLLVALCLFTTSQNHQFLSPINLTNQANIIGLFGIFSIGAGIIIIAGGIDLSVGSMIALVGILLSMSLREWHWPWPLAVLFVIVVPVILGCFHGWLITRMNLQPFIVTLCSLLIIRSMARYFAHDTTKGFGDSKGLETITRITQGKLFGIPMPFVILLLVAFVMWFVLHRSIYGRYLLAVGRNEQATRFSGINTRRIIASSYIIGGALTGISGILFAFWTNSISPSNMGSSYEMYGIAAAVLGGCSLRGGEGSIIGIVIGAALLQVLQNLVNLLGIDTSLNNAVMGVVILLGVIADQLFQKHRAKKTASQPK
jgi:ribose transport system permease protein